MTETATITTPIVFNDLDLKVEIQALSNRVVRLKEEMEKTFDRLWIKFLGSLKASYTVPGVDREIEPKNTVSEIKAVPTPQPVPVTVGETNYEILQDQIRDLEANKRAILLANRVIVATSAFFKNFVNAGKGKNYVGIVEEQAAPVIEQAPIAMTVAEEPISSEPTFEPLPEEFAQRDLTASMSVETPDDVRRIEPAESVEVTIPTQEITTEVSETPIELGPIIEPVVSVSADLNTEREVGENNIAASELQEEILSPSDVIGSIQSMAADYHRMHEQNVSYREKIESQSTEMEDLRRRLELAERNLRKVTVTINSLTSERDSAEAKAKQIEEKANARVAAVEANAKQIEEKANARVVDAETNARNSVLKIVRDINNAIPKTKAQPLQDQQQPYKKAA